MNGAMKGDFQAYFVLQQGEISVGERTTLHPPRKMPIKMCDFLRKAALPFLLMRIAWKVEPTNGKRNTQWAIDDAKALHKKVRQSARQDRGKWLETLTASGDWNAIRKLRVDAAKDVK